MTAEAKSLAPIVLGLGAAALVTAAYYAGVFGEVGTGDKIVYFCPEHGWMMPCPLHNQ